MIFRRSILSALVTLLLVPVLGAAAPLTPPTAVIEATELYHVSAPETLGGSAIKVDGAGDLFVAAVHYVGNDTRIVVNEYDHNGGSLGQWPVAAPPQPSGYDKLDSVSLSASDHDLIVGMTSHLTANRDYPLSVARINNVYTPYTTRVAEDGPGAYVPAAGGSTGLSDADVGRVASAVATIEAPQFQRVIDNLQPKVAGLFNGSQGNAWVYNQLLNTSYSGTLAALRDYRTPTATPHP